MKEIQDMIDKLGVSRPIFNVVASTLGDELNLHVLPSCMYNPPPLLGISDPVEKLVLMYYYETFNKYSHKFEVRVQIKSVVEEMGRCLRKAYISASPNKKPKTTDLYEWVYHLVSRPALHPYLIALYRYMMQHTDGDFRFDGINNEHAKNFISILTRIKEKYE